MVLYLPRSKARMVPAAFGAAVVLIGASSLEGEGGQGRGYFPGTTPTAPLNASGNPQRGAVMRLAILCGLALLLWSPTAGHLSAALPESPAPLEKYRALVHSHQQAQQEFSKAYDAAKTDEERQRVLKDLGAKASADHYAGQFLQL